MTTIMAPLWWWTCLAVVLCVESVTAASTPRESNNNLSAIIKDLQKRFERMEERNTRLERELMNARTENTDLKTRLMKEFSNATAENLELKTRLKQDMQATSDTMFFATISAETIPISTEAMIVFDNALINPGSHYNTAEGTYTAPLNGYYQFSVMKRSDVSQAKWWLLVDGTRRTWYNMDYHEADGSGSVTPTSASTINLQLTAGQIVRIENDQSNNVYGTDSSGTMQSWFTGFMIFAL